MNGIALAVVEAMVEATDLAAWSAAIGSRRTSLVDDLRSRGLTVCDSDACWVLVDRPGLRRALVPHGVLVRDCASFGLVGVHRIAVPGDTGRERLLTALDLIEP